MGGDITDIEILERLLALNLARVQEPAPDHPRRALAGSAPSSGYSALTMVAERLE